MRTTLDDLCDVNRIIEAMEADGTDKTLPARFNEIISLRSKIMRAFNAQTALIQAATGRRPGAEQPSEPLTDDELNRIRGQFLAEPKETP
jgi:hypothetical protein